MTAKILMGVALLAMSEDVEIMRQMVERTVGDAYTTRAATRFLYIHVSPDYFGASHGKAGDATGVYLPGYGVLIQLAAPMPFPEVSQMKRDGGGEPLSQWEAARRKLQGETSVEQLIVSAVPDSTHTPTRDQLTRRVLEVLAENGHNFRELPPSERLTVDVVFRDRKAARCAECHDADAWSLGVKMSVKRQMRGLGLGLRETGSLANDMAHAVQGLSVQLKSADENAGDLHMRQKNYTKATEAYMKALEFSRKRRPDDTVARSRLKDEAVQSLYRKLAQANVAAGQYKDAAGLLKLLADKAAQRDVSVDWFAVETAKPGRQPDSPAAALPAHLIISATKSQLDAVAEGKMSRDEFAKAAQIEYLDPLEASVEEKSENGKPSKRR